jgi:hypothetical protein
MRITCQLGCTTLDEQSPEYRIFLGAGGPPIETTPIEGIGDSAVLLRIPVDDQMLVSLRVQCGADEYTFNAADALDMPDRLFSVAKETLAAATANSL